MIWCETENKKAKKLHIGRTDAAAFNVIMSVIFADYPRFYYSDVKKTALAVEKIIASEEIEYKNSISITGYGETLAILYTTGSGRVVSYEQGMLVVDFGEKGSKHFADYLIRTYLGLDDLPSWLMEKTWRMEFRRDQFDSRGTAVVVQLDTDSGYHNTVCVQSVPYWLIEANESYIENASLFLSLASFLSSI